MQLITLSDLETITGLSNDTLSALIPYAQAQAKALLGFLEEETKSETIFIEERTKEIQLDLKPINSIESLSYTTSSTSEATDITEYRTITSKGLIVLDSYMHEDYIVIASYKVGWTQTTIPDLVKVLLSVVTVDHYYSLFPEQQLTSNVIVQEKIGDYMVKYSGYVKGTYKSMDEWVDYLVSLIRSGEYFTTVE